MEDVIRIHDRYYILATSGFPDDRTRVLKHDDTFVVFDRFGDIQPLGHGQQGLFHDGTRYLSRLDLRIGTERPMLLGSTVERDNAALVAHLTNADITAGDHVVVQRDTVHFERTSLLWERACHTRLVARNFDPSGVTIDVALLFEADFADIFEVRGVTRAARGTLLEPVVDGDMVRIAYRGLDGVVRYTVLSFSPRPVRLSPGRADLALRLPADEEATIVVTVECALDKPPARPRSFDEAAEAARNALSRNGDRPCIVHTSSQRFNDWLARSAADLAMMRTRTPWGPYPYAGVPWFCAPFGRDGIVTALELLWLEPAIARGVLRFLAATQATATDPAADAEPGKIIHEMRGGEMAALGEIPFARYYGSVDATPLFVLLAAAYFKRTGDLALIAEIRPSIERALAWIDEYGDLDGDGFVEYARRAAGGLRNQGWKDSEDAVFHADGSLAEGAIALCEVQAYVYGAKRGAARLAAALGDEPAAERLGEAADRLRASFRKVFWCPEIGTYALALDGAKRPCRVRTSNAGHCLFTGIASVAQARTATATLMSPASFSGWGIRTVAASEQRYNPMSYHNGSVWPHDNAIVASGMGRYGHQGDVERVLDAFFRAGLAVDLQRMPELLCGFTRRPGSDPTLYPVACAPQAWAAGAVYMLLAASLGLSIDAPDRRVRFAYSRLPSFLDRVWIENLRVGQAVVDLELRRRGDDVGINVTRREGAVEVVAVK